MSGRSEGAADPVPPQQAADSSRLIRNGPGPRVTGWRRTTARPLIWLVRGYQILLAPLLLGQHCRYHPSCSTYAVRALQVHGPITGLALTGWRLLRCNPFTKGGVDPVPRLGRWLPDVHPDGRPRSAGLSAYVGPPGADPAVSTGEEHDTISATGAAPAGGVQLRSPQHSPMRGLT